MLKESKRKRVPARLALQCNACGNSGRFLEIMELESHLVDGDLTYVHLVDAIVEEYRCCTCGNVVRRA